MLGLGFILSSVSPALAVQPASVRLGDDVDWSEVVENPFDGKVVYDKNYKNDFILVSSWSRKGIGVTYTRIGSVFVGYDSRSNFGLGYGLGNYPRYRRSGLGLLFNQEAPVYQPYFVEEVPNSISLAIDGKVYTYESGPVSPELAAALVSASPEKNVLIRLSWKDGTTRDTEIGKDTVKAWKTIFGQS